MKILIWGETRERVWTTAGSARDLFPDCQIIIGSGDEFQQENRMLESFAAFGKFDFKGGYDGKLDFIADHKDDPFLFAMEGVLLNESIKEYTNTELGGLTFFNIALDDGRFLAKCNPAQGGFSEAFDVPQEFEGGQNLLCFHSGGGIKYPKFFSGNFGEGLTLSFINESRIVKGHVRYIGNLDLQITQKGFFVLMMGLKSTGLFDEHQKESGEIVEDEVRERVLLKVEKELIKQLS
jgi:hypothetical protein